MTAAQTQAAWDLAPTLRLLLLGLLLALGPLAWVWLRNARAGAHQRLRALTVLTLFLTFDLVLFGAFTRLTDSGLGCPDWPGCYGQASPVGAQVQISAAQEAMPTGPVTHQKAWIEMIHRYAASAVGVLIAVLALANWLLRKRQPTALVWPIATLVWVCIQGAFGALTVTMKLFPAIVTLHLLGGMALLALLQVQVTRASPLRTSPRVRHAALVAYALLWLQIALGGWVSTNYAVLACTEFPLCQGQWVPPMDMAQGFELWRELGQTGAGQTIDFGALTAIHIVHRSFAFVLLAALCWLVWCMVREPALGKLAKAISAVLAVQMLSGLSNVVLDWPLFAALVHTGGAAALVLLLTHTLAGYTASPPLPANAALAATP